MYFYKNPLIIVQIFLITKYLIFHQAVLLPKVRIESLWTCFYHFKFSFNSSGICIHCPIQCNLLVMPWLKHYIFIILQFTFSSDILLCITFMRITWPFYRLNIVFEVAHHAVIMLLKFANTEIRMDYELNLFCLYV